MNALYRSQNLALLAVLVGVFVFGMQVGADATPQSAILEAYILPAQERLESPAVYWEVTVDASRMRESGFNKLKIVISDGDGHSLVTEWYAVEVDVSKSTHTVSGVTRVPSLYARRVKVLSASFYGRGESMELSAPIGDYIPSPMAYAEALPVVPSTLIYQRTYPYSYFAIGFGLTHHHGHHRTSFAHPRIHIGVHHGAHPTIHHRINLHHNRHHGLGHGSSIRLGISKGRLSGGIHVRPHGSRHSSRHHSGMTSGHRSH